jgi:adenylate cyclase
MIRPQLRILAAGECSAVLPVLARVSRMGFKFQVQRFSFPEEVLSHLQDWAPDVLFVDADCADFSASKLCRALKEHPVTRLWPLLVVSCSTRACSDALAAGADDFLTPQIPSKVLLNRLQGLAQLSLARREATAAVLETDESQHEKVRRMVRRYLLPQPAARMEGKGEALVGEEICAHAVILFADLRGYNRISERLTPGDLVPLLNEYFSLLTEITYQHGGTIFHMAGDSLLVGFGVPQVQSDSPERAIRTAQEMLTRFGELATAWRKRSHLMAGLGVGLHEGTVAAAALGSILFMNYTLIGDVVNIASRLCQRARAGEMVFSGTLMHTLNARGLTFPAVQLPPITLRDRSEPIDIFCAPLEKRLDLSDHLPPPLALLKDSLDRKRR